MKIAIRGHESRGKEVIQILESLGGKNSYALTGDNHLTYYHIYENNIMMIHNSIDYKLYTLEEFEKEFPFKIGNEVIFSVTNGWLSGKVTGLTYVEDRLKYEVDNRIGDYRYYYYVESHKLRLYPMKEERNITLTLEKAKEWYKKGGELKEIALQAFTEKELNPLPKNWEEFCKQGNPVASWRYNIPIKYEALFKLEQLRDCWRQGWKPKWDSSAKYAIKWDTDDLTVFTAKIIHSFLVFPTREMAEEFLECFRDLIEKAGDLI